jgi:hypothetical protein
MTTSANVTEFTIRRDGIKVGEHREHALCKYFYHELLKYQPATEFTIQSHWPDEDEVVHDGEEMSLDTYLQHYRDMGRRYRDGCTMEECFTAPKGVWGLPDLDYVKANRKQETI